MTGRGGWPMTVFLTPDGRPFFGGTYFPPATPTACPASAGCSTPSTRPGATGATRSSARPTRWSTAIDRRTTDARRPDGRPPTADVEPGLGAYPTLLAGGHGRAGGALRRRLGRVRARPEVPPARSWWSCACATHRVTGDGGVAGHGRRRRWRPWPPAGSTTTWAAASPATRPTPPGRSPTSRRCSTTRPGWCASTCTPGWSPATTAGTRWSRRPSPTCCATWPRPAAGSTAPRTPTPRARRAASTSGPRTRWPRRSAPSSAPSPPTGTGSPTAGNFEGRTILRRPLGCPAARPAEVEEARRRLFEARPARVRPGLDDKVLTEWNAMFGSALAEAAAATGRRDWAEAAVGIAEFLLAELRRPADGRWLRSWQDGRARHLGLRRRLRLGGRLLHPAGRAHRRGRWLDTAAETARAMLELFAGDGGPALHHRGTTPSRSSCGPPSSSTAPSPSASAVAAGALLRLGRPHRATTRSPRPARPCSSALRPRGRRATRWPRAHAMAACGLAGGGITEVVVAGRPARPPRHGQAGASSRRSSLAWGERTRLAAVGGTRRRARLRLPALRLPGTGGRPRPSSSRQLDGELAGRRADGTRRARDDARRERRTPRAAAEAPAHAGRQPARRRRADGRQIAGPGPGHPPLHGARLQGRGHHRRRPATPGPSSGCASTGPRTGEPDLAPFDVVDAAWADDPERDDLAQPEAVTVAGMPERCWARSGDAGPGGSCATWSPPTSPHLLGFPGTVGARTGSSAACGRRWPSSCPSRGPGPLPPPRGRHGVGPLRLAPQRQLAPGGGPPGHGRPVGVAPRPAVGQGPATALGFRPHFLVVALSRPRDGHCYKTVAAMLPRP